jgi:hypothetical protein
LLRVKDIDSQEKHAVDCAYEEQDGEIHRLEEAVIKDTFLHYERFIQSEKYKSHAAHGETSNDLGRVPGIGASAPCQANDERGEGSRHSEDANVVDVKDYILENMMAAEERSRREVCYGDRKGCETVDDAVEIVCPAPAACTSCIITNKSCCDKCS